MSFKWCIHFVFSNLVISFDFEICIDHKELSMMNAFSCEIFGIVNRLSRTQPIFLGIQNCLSYISCPKSLSDLCALYMPFKWCIHFSFRTVSFFSVTKSRAFLPMGSRHFLRPYGVGSGVLFTVFTVFLFHRCLEFRNDTKLNNSRVK